ncbi:MAG: hypothetical protein V3T40_02660 [Nitrososphaerales archaeon]
MKYLTWTVFSSMILIGSSMVILTVVNLYIKNQDLQEEQEINGKIKSADEHLLLAVGRLNEAREYVGTSQHLLNKASYDEVFNTCKLGISSYSEAKKHYLITTTEYESALQKLQNLSDKKFDILHKIFLSNWGSEDQSVRKIQEQITELEFEINMVIPRIEQHIQMENGCSHIFPPRHVWNVV